MVVIRACLLLGQRLHLMVVVLTCALAFLFTDILFTDICDLQLWIDEGLIDELSTAIRVALGSMASLIFAMDFPWLGHVGRACVLC